MSVLDNWGAVQDSCTTVEQNPALADAHREAGRISNQLGGVTLEGCKLVNPHENGVRAVDLPVRNILGGTVLVSLHRRRGIGDHLSVDSVAADLVG